MRIMALIGIITTTLGVMLMSWVQSTAGDVAVPCSEVPVMDTLTVQPDFELERFLGDWYRINSLAHNRPNVTLLPRSDHTFSFKFEDDTETNKTWISFVKVVRTGGDCHVLDRGNHLSTTPEPGKLKLYRNERRSVVQDFWILETDYDDYALVYACHEKDLEGRCEPTATYMYVLGRQTSLLPGHRRAVDSKLTSLCVDMEDIVTTTFDQPCDAGTRHVISLSLVLVLAMLSIATR